MLPTRADAEAALAQLPAELLAALLPLALEETWHPVRSLAAAPDLPESWWGQVLEQLPLQPDEEGGAQVPQALQEALSHRLATDRPRRYRELILRRSEEALQAGEIRQALTLLHGIGEAQRAHLQLEGWMNERIRAGDYQLIQATFEAFPQAWINPRTRAVYWTAVISDSDRDKAALARREIHHAHDAGERNPRLIHCMVYTLQLDGLYSPALHHVDEALAVGTTGRDTLQLLQMRSMLLSYLQRVDEHLETALALLAEAQTQGDLYFTALAHATVGYAREDTGALDAAEDHYHRAIALYSRISQWPQLATLLNNYAQSLATAGRPAEALQRVDEAARLPTLTPRHHAWLTFTAAIIHHQYGQHAVALTASRRAAELLHAAHLTSDEGSVLLIEAERLALDGQQALAEQRHNEARTLIADSPRDVSRLDFTASVLAYARQHWQEAEAGFLRAVAGDVDSWDRARAELYLIALALHQGTEPDTAALADSLTALGTDAPLLTDVPLLQGTLGWLRRQPAWRERLGRLFDSSPLPGHVPLRLELLGSLEIYSQAQRLHFPLRRSAELLAFLALHGPATRQQILAALWEGQSDERGKTTDLFKKALKGLREVLRPLLPPGADPVVIEGGRHTLHSLFALSTAWLPGVLFPAATIRQSGPVEVRGPFLADAQGPWADEARAEVHERLLDQLLLQEGEGDPTVLQALKVVRGLA